MSLTGAQVEERRGEWLRNIEDEGGCGVSSLFGLSSAPSGTATSTTSRVKWMLSDREDGVRARFQLRKNLHFNSHEQAAYGSKATKAELQRVAEAKPPPTRKRDWPPSCWARIFSHCQLLLALEASVNKRSLGADGEDEAQHLDHRSVAWDHVIRAGEKPHCSWHTHSALNTDSMSV